MATTLAGANLNERVYDELRTRILTRREPAGAKLSLHALASELGVSRSPVHHALTRLVSEGLLTVQPRRGYYVTPGDRARGRGGVRRAARARAPRGGTRGRPAHAKSSSIASPSCSTRQTAAISHEQWDAANAAFHEHQIDLAGNALLSRFYRELSVNLMMQVIRGGRRRGPREPRHGAPPHRRGIPSGRPRGRRTRDPRAHRDRTRIALDAIERAGGVL